MHWSEIPSLAGATETTAQVLDAAQGTETTDPTGGLGGLGGFREPIQVGLGILDDLERLVTHPMAQRLNLFGGFGGQQQGNGPGDMIQQRFGAGNGQPAPQADPAAQPQVPAQANSPPDHSKQHPTETESESESTQEEPMLKQQIAVQLISAQPPEALKARVQAYIDQVPADQLQAWIIQLVNSGTQEQVDMLMTAVDQDEAQAQLDDQDTPADDEGEAQDA